MAYHGPGRPAHRVRKLKEKPNTTLMAVSDPFEGGVDGLAFRLERAWTPIYARRQPL
jgi:hypothetical protein